MSMDEGYDNLLFAPPSGGPDAGVGSGPDNAGSAGVEPTADLSGATWANNQLGASNAIASLMLPAAQAALSAPAGSLTKDRIVGDTAGILGALRAGGDLSDDQFGHIVRGAIGFVSGVPDAASDPDIRSSVLNAALAHMVAHAQLQGLAGVDLADGSTAGGVVAAAPGNGLGADPASPADPGTHSIQRLLGSGSHG